MGKGSVQDEAQDSARREESGAAHQGGGSGSGKMLRSVWDLVNAQTTSRVWQPEGLKTLV